MGQNQLLFFATRDDLVEVIRQVEGSHHLKYVRISLSPKDEPEVYESALELPSVASGCLGEMAEESSYLILDRSDEVLVRAIPQKRGGVLFATYPHPRSVMFKPGGHYDARHLISGEIVTAAGSSEALRIYSMFESAIKKEFKRVKSYRVGANALRELDAGVRLTRSIGTPAEYDLVR